MTLAGVIFVRNGIEFDYCFVESIQCLTEFCDMVVVVDAGSTDGTDLVIQSLENPKIHKIMLPQEEWFKHQGKEKLSIFTNVGYDYLQDFNVDWVFYLQADEIVHEDSYSAIRHVMEIPNVEGFLVNRYNLWKDCYHMLNVPQERKPCSTEVIRLTKPHCRAIGDAESIDAQSIYIPAIDIFHMGFVRDKRVMPKKVTHMQKDVFLMNPDEKLKGMEVFDSSQWFTDEDLAPIPKPLPKIIEKWAKERL